MTSAPYPLSFDDIEGAPAPGTLLCHRRALEGNRCVELHYRQGDRIFNGFICQHEGEIRAYKNSCPHTGSPMNMAEGQFFSNDGSELQCRTHDARFNPKNGRCVAGPCRDEWLQKIVIVVDGDKVLAG